MYKIQEEGREARSVKPNLQLAVSLSTNPLKRREADVSIQCTSFLIQGNVLVLVTQRYGVHGELYSGERGR